MKSIVLVCAGGMSTSLLMNKMNEVAATRGDDVQTTAMSVEAFEKYDGPCDVLLLGPQLSHRKKDIEGRLAGTGIRVAVIDMMAYGMMDGEKVLDAALELMGA